VIPPGDIGALEEALLTLLSDAGLMHRMGEAGRKRAVEMFSLEEMITRTEALYCDLVERKA
jgi:glycosyltransferase involved in cell wall biosynthesis